MGPRIVQANGVELCIIESFGDPAHSTSLERTGHEYFPPHTWDIAVPAILAHTSR